MRKSNRRGSIAVESVFSFIIIFLILSAAIDYGIYFHRQTALIKSSATAAQHMSIYPEDKERAIAIAKDSFYMSTSQEAFFQADLSDGHVVISANSDFYPIFGMLPVPESHEHQAAILIRDF